MGIVSRGGLRSHAGVEDGRRRGRSASGVGGGRGKRTRRGREWGGSERAAGRRKGGESRAARRRDGGGRGWGTGCQGGRSWRDASQGGERLDDPQWSAAAASHNGTTGSASQRRRLRCGAENQPVAQSYMRREPVDGEG